jgi:hypothetical protein
MSGWFGYRLALLKFSDSLNNSSDYFSRFRFSRADAKLFKVIPMFGSFGKRFAYSKYSTSLYSPSDYFSRFSF